MVFGGCLVIEVGGDMMANAVSKLIWTLLTEIPIKVSKLFCLPRGIWITFQVTLGSNNKHPSSLAESGAVCNPS